MGEPAENLELGPVAGGGSAAADGEGALPGGVLDDQDGGLAGQAGGESGGGGVPADPRIEEEVISPIYHPCGSRLFKILPETSVDAVAVSKEVSLRDHLMDIAGALARTSGIRFAANILERDLMAGLLPGDRVMVLDPSGDPNAQGGPALYIMLPDGSWRGLGDSAAMAGLERHLAEDQGPHWLLGEFYFFRHPEPLPGFEVLDGGLIENGAELYPEFWQFIQTSRGQALLKTAEERQALANHVYFTLADGTEITYNGIGGVPYFTIDMEAGSITMPDIRGMHLEASGLGGLEPGGAAMDASRGIAGWIGFTLTNSGTADGARSGPFVCRKNIGANITGSAPASPSWWFTNNEFLNHLAEPTGPVNRPRSAAMLACAWMGRPALED